MWHGSFLTDSRKWYLDAQHYFLNVIYFICDSLRHVTWLVLDWFSYVISRRAALLFLCDILHSWLTQTRDMTPPLDWFSYVISRRADLCFYVMYFIRDSTRHVRWVVLDWFSYVISRRAALLFLCDILHLWLTPTRKMTCSWLILVCISRRAALLFLRDMLHSWLTQTRDMTPPLDWFSYVIFRRAVLFFAWYTSFVTHSGTWDDSFLTDSRMRYLDAQHSFFMWYTSSMTHPDTWDESFLTDSRMWYLDAQYRFFYVIYFICDSLRHVR